jgi:DNA-binding response OmpR family regulator
MKPELQPMEYRAARIPLPNGMADLPRNEVRFENGSRCDLTEREAGVLGYLAARPGQIVSRDEILLEVWGLNPQRIITRTIDMHIAHLRDKLRDDPTRPQVLFTVHGRGYRFGTEGTPCTAG